MSVKIKVTDKSVRLYTPYDSTFVRRVKQLGGKWDTVCWTVPAEYEQQARDLLIEIYGTDGTPGPVHTLDVNLSAADVSGDSFRIGPVMALRKKWRDSAPDVGPGCAVIHGSLKSYGGSAKYPSITYKDKTTLRIPNVPAAIAQRLVADNPDAYSIVADTNADDQLSEEEQALVEQLQALSTERRQAVLNALT